MAKSKLRRIPIFFCAECGNPDYMTQPNKIFCSQVCRQTQWNRRITGGFKLYEAVMTWRIDRPRDAMSELTKIADQLASDEREIRKRRAANIATQRALLSSTDDVVDDQPTVIPGESRSAAVSLSPAQQRAAAAAGVFALAFAADRTPNDPEQRPDGWPPETLDALRNAILTLGGAVPEYAND